MPFQNRVNTYQPPAVEGDFASSNPRSSVDTIPGGLVAGPAGVIVGRFAWVGPDGCTVTNYSTTANKPDGFVARAEGLALITQYLAESGNLIPAGFPVTLFNEGDYFVKNRDGAASVRDQQIFASSTDGTAHLGSAPAGATFTGSIGATFTGTGSGLNLTVTAVTGLISIGDTIAGTGVPAGTTITGQTSGTTGGAGVYTTSVATTATAATITSFGTVMNVTAVASGILAPGQVITGTGVPAGASLGPQVSGATGGVGVYTIDVPATAYAASTTVTATGGVLTNFVAKTVAAVGELFKMSTWGKV